MKRNIVIILLAGVTLSGHSQRVLSLDECKQMALSHNYAIRSADNKIEQAREQQKEAYTNYFPQVSGTGAFFLSTNDMVKTEINTADMLPSEMAQMIPTEMLSMIPQNISFSTLDHGGMIGVMAMQPVYAGGQITNGNKLAQVGYEVSELQKTQSQNHVELTTEQYYWQIVTLKEKQNTLNSVAEMLLTIEKDAQTAVDAGVALRNDLLQVQLKQNEIKSNQLKLENALQLLKMVMGQYIGLSDSESAELDVDVKADPSTLPPYPISLKQDAAVAVLNTPEYQLLRKNVEATNLQVKMEEGKNMPSIGVGVGLSYNNMTGKNNGFGMVFCSVSVPISCWWNGQHNIKRKMLAEANARDMLSDNTELLKIRVQKNWNDVDDAYKQLELAHKSIEQSEENLRLNRNQYQAGVSKMSDLLQAQTLYQQSRDQYTDAFTLLQTKIIEYKKAVGQ